MQPFKFIEYLSILLLVGLLGASVSARAADVTALTTEILPAKPPTDASRDASHDFDFLYGKWTMHNRKLIKRLAGSHTWEEYPSTDECQPLPGGIGNEDFFRTDDWPRSGPGFVGVTIRIYDPETKLWSIYWIDNRNNPHGKLEAPVIGSFNKNIGIFEGPDTFGGKPILVRYTWTLIDHDHAHFEQAFSIDGGKTWETNFMNDLARAG